jgi:hypothetical protein
LGEEPAGRGVFRRGYGESSIVIGLPGPMEDGMTRKGPFRKDYNSRSLLKKDVLLGPTDRSSCSPSQVGFKR